MIIHSMTAIPLSFWPVAFRQRAEHHRIVSIATENRPPAAALAKSFDRNLGKTLAGQIVVGESTPD
jgi:hypothetical protein